MEETALDNPIMHLSHQNVIADTCVASNIISKCKYLYFSFRKSC
jgi:hypothetical protein